MFVGPLMAYLVESRPIDDEIWATRNSMRFPELAHSVRFKDAVEE